MLSLLLLFLWLVTLYALLLFQYIFLFLIHFSYLSRCLLDFLIFFNFHIGFHLSFLQIEGNEVRTWEDKRGFFTVLFYISSSSPVCMPAVCFLSIVLYIIFILLFLSLVCLCVYAMLHWLTRLFLIFHPFILSVRLLCVFLNITLTFISMLIPSLCIPGHSLLRVRCGMMFQWVAQAQVRQSRQENNNRDWPLDCCCCSAFLPAMATFFGEVRYLVSRAYDEEDDDDEDTPGITWVLTGVHVCMYVCFLSLNSAYQARLQIFSTWQVQVHHISTCWNVSHSCALHILS